MYTSFIGDSKKQNTWTNNNEMDESDGPITRRDWDTFIIEAKAIIASRKSGTHSMASKSIIVDSGASYHMICDRSLMSNIKAASWNVLIANGNRIPIEGVGSLKLFDKESAAFYLPRFTSNLILLKKATVNLDCQVIFIPNEVEFQDLKTAQVIGRGGSRNELYHLQTTKFSKLPTSICLSSASYKCDSITWHARLGHLHTRAFQIIMPNMSFNHLECEACILGKHCKTAFPTS